MEVAYDQYNKLHINAVEAIDRMSVGSAAHGGYFDFVSTVYGMGIKWRAVQSAAPASSPVMLMAKRMSVYEALKDESGVFSIDFGGNES